ncbi:MAG: hypothetical protein J5718_05465 [Lachnospiraceae bacterium]|nr:hypothetical protein [Lachnospiraceae bacterium]
MKKIIGIMLGIVIMLSCQGCGMSGNNDKVIVDDEKGLDIVSMISDGTAADLKRGQVVAFGKFEQDNNDSNGSESINWVVLNVNKDKKEITLTSKYALECMPYDSEEDLKNRFPDGKGGINWDNVNVTWEDSTLRTWLNNDFYNSAFGDEEKKLVAKQTLENKDNSYGNCTGKGGNSTEDYVFIFSNEEIVNTDYGYDYNNENADENRRCTCTEYAKAHGGKNFSWNSKLCCFYWLRSPGFTNKDATYVSDHGYVGMNGVHVSKYEYDNDCCVRPVIVLEMK